MWDQFKKDAGSFQPSTGPFFFAIILFAFTAFAILIVSHFLWVLPDTRCIGLIDGNYTFDGRIEFGSLNLHFELEYNIPNGTLEKVMISGPLKLGIAAGPPDSAITLCGGDLPCIDIEHNTCKRESTDENPLPLNCARLAGTINRLDSTTPDVGHKLARTLTKIRDRMNRYVMTAHANGQQFMWQIGPICQRSVHLPTG